MTRPDGAWLSTVASDGWAAPGLAQPHQGYANRIHQNVMSAVQPLIRRAWCLVPSLAPSLAPSLDR
jgi:hypothetical protein